MEKLFFTNISSETFVDSNGVAFRFIDGRLAVSDPDLKDKFDNIPMEYNLKHFEILPTEFQEIVQVTGSRVSILVPSAIYVFDMGFTTGYNEFTKIIRPRGVLYHDRKIFAAFDTVDGKIPVYVRDYIISR